MIDDPLGGFPLGDAWDDAETQGDFSLVSESTELFEMSLGDYPFADLVEDFVGGGENNWDRLLHPPVGNGLGSLSRATHPRSRTARPMDEE